MRSKSTDNRFRALPRGWILAAVAVALASVGADDPQVHVAPRADGGGTAYLGVHLREEVDHEQGGARVTEVVEDSPAGEAGLREDDIVIEFDGHVVRGPAALTQWIHARQPGDRVKVVVDRNGERRTFEVELGERDSIIVLAPTPGVRAYVPDPEKLKEWAEHLREQSKAWSGRAHEFTVQPEAWGFQFSGKPRLGVELVETTPELRKHLGGSEDAGILISRILRGTPAERAGLRVGDLIVAVDGHPIDDSRNLVRELDDLVGTTFPVRIVREKKAVTVEVTLDEPEEDSPTGPRAHVRPLPPPDAPAIAPIAPLPPPRPPRAPRPPRPDAMAPPAAPPASDAPPAPVAPRVEPVSAVPDRSV